MNNIYIKLFALLFICILISGSVEASTKTKHLAIGDINLVIEAPLGMCFVDQGSSSTVDIYKDLLGRLYDYRQKQLMTIFAPCEKLIKFAGSLNANNIVDNFAYISWLTPTFTSYYKHDREKFKDDIIAHFKKKGLGGFVKLDNGVGTIIRESKDVGGLIVEEITLVGYTVLRTLPIEIRIKDSMENFQTANKSYTLLNNFINYQIRLNEND